MESRGSARQFCCCCELLADMVAEDWVTEDILWRGEEAAEEEGG